MKSSFYIMLLITVASVEAIIVILWANWNACGMY